MKSLNCTRRTRSRLSASVLTNGARPSSRRCRRTRPCRYGAPPRRCRAPSGGSRARGATTTAFSSVITPGAARVGQDAHEAVPEHVDRVLPAQCARRPGAEVERRRAGRGGRFDGPLERRLGRLPTRVIGDGAGDAVVQVLDSNWGVLHQVDAAIPSRTPGSCEHVEPDVTDAEVTPHFDRSVERERHRGHRVHRHARMDVHACDRSGGRAATRLSGRSTCDGPRSTRVRGPPRERGGSPGCVSARVFEFCSGLVDLVVCVGRHFGGGHRLALAGERFVGLVAEDVAQVCDGVVNLGTPPREGSDGESGYGGGRFEASEPVEQYGESGQGVRQ